MRLRRPLPAVQGDTLHIVGVGDNRIGKLRTWRILPSWKWRLRSSLGYAAFTSLHHQDLTGRYQLFQDVRNKLFKFISIQSIVDSPKDVIICYFNYSFGNSLSNGFIICSLGFNVFQILGCACLILAYPVITHTHYR